MGRKKKPVEIHERVKPHTIKKFELIEKYAEEWAYKILGTSDSKGIVFVDCMSNSGSYLDEQDNVVEGTCVRVSRKVKSAMLKFRDKKATLYFNDKSAERVEELKKNIDINLPNVNIVYNVGDANEFLKNMNLNQYRGYCILLLYDPYNAEIDWDALTPFFNSWGEVIINHMISDTKRGVAQAKREYTIRKYTETYQMEIDKLVNIATDKVKLEQVVEEIILSRIQNKNRQVYIASFPFFNRNNGQVYNLILFTRHIKGFVLYKKVAWQTFGDKSSMKKTHGVENQIYFNFDNEITFSTEPDEYCYSVIDIAKYIYEKYKTSETNTMDEIYNDLEKHPIFPVDGYKKQIKKALRMYEDVQITRDNNIYFR